MFFVALLLLLENFEGENFEVPEVDAADSSAPARFF